MGNANWKLKVNVAGVKPFEPGTFDRLSDGVHLVKILRTEQDEAKKEGAADNITFYLEVAEGPDAGKTTRRWLTTDQEVLKDPEAIPRKEWKNLLLSIAKDPANLEKGELDLGPNTFAGKTAYLYVSNPPDVGSKKDGKTVYANMNFVTPDQAKKLKSAMSMKTAPKGNNGALKEFAVTSAAQSVETASAALGDL